MEKSILREGQWLQQVGNNFYIMEEPDKEMNYEKALNRLKFILSNPSMASSFYSAVSILFSN